MKSIRRRDRYNMGNLQGRSSVDGWLLPSEAVAEGWEQPLLLMSLPGEVQASSGSCGTVVPNHSHRELRCRISKA